MQSPFPFCVWLALSLLVCGISLSAQTPAHAITLTSNPTTAWETQNSSVDLHGTTTVSGEIKNVLWVNQMGLRGTGTWTPGSGNSTNWSLPNVPLRLGINQIAVTMVYGTNSSTSLHLAINRKPEAGNAPPQPLEVRTGVWKNRQIVYQVWNGMAVVEGDIILAPAASLQSAPTGGGFTSDGLAISSISQLWPVVGTSHQVPYIITGSNANLTTALSNFNTQFKGIIQFVARQSQTNYVNITVEAGGSGEGFSNEGMAGGEQTLQCGSGCTVATWLHEMGHTIGLLHEHQRPDRNNFITLNLANADLPNVPGNFTLLPFDYQTMGLYDYASVMHYGAFDFSKAGLPVIESIPAGIPLGNNNGYSSGDIDQISRLYGFAPQTVTIATNPPGLQVNVNTESFKAPFTLSGLGGALNAQVTLSVYPSTPQQPDPPDGSSYIFANWSDRGAQTHNITLSPGSGTLTSPATAPATTVYQANFIRLQPFATPTVYPSGTGTISVSPASDDQYGAFLTDRTLVQITLTPTANSGYNFYDWFNLPYPPSDNPHSFYIQSPLTEGQAVFVSTPVTIVGESITGPNTWNPGLAGYVDGSFNYLPTAFSSYYNGTAWNAGTTHSISVPQTQSPVTTNVFYNWNTWSDHGAITHNITQPATGTQSVSASLTPFYASYTVPPPLGTQGSACYGGVATSPAGVAYADNSTFDFYQDGTSVTSTATANSSFPGLTFAGWSGSLSGSTNPDTTTIHDQFVPTALFNTSTTPLTITSLSPSSVSATSSAANITITGTGFSSATAANWNGASRPLTYVSPTQLTLHLNAGDLASPGGQDLYVYNSVSGGSNSYCGPYAETTLIVANPPLPADVPLPGFVYYLSGEPAFVFQETYSDPKGATDLTGLRLLINSAITAAHGCYVQYVPATNSMYLENDAGTGVSAAVTPGSPSSVSNSQCTLSGIGSSLSLTADTMTVSYALTFSESFAQPGQQKVYVLGSGSGGTAGWVQEGFFTLANSGGTLALAALPSQGAGPVQTFSVLYSDAKGSADLATARILFNTSISASSGCYVLYNPAQNAMYLENDAGTGTSAAVTPGSSSSVSNSLCTLSGAGSSVSTTQLTMTVNYALTFSGPANTQGDGSLIFFGLAGGSGLAYGWNELGHWTPVPQLPEGLSVSPSYGLGQTQSFTAAYYDPGGVANLTNARILFNTTIASGGCYAQYNPAANTLTLNGTSGTLTPGSSSSLSNAACTLSGTGTSVSKSGNTMTVTYALSFSSSFVDVQNIYLLCAGTGGAGSAGWTQVGTWTQ